MAVVQVITKARGTSGSAMSKGERKYTLRFQVITNDLNDGPQTVGAALGITPFNLYSYGNDLDTGARAKEISIVRGDDDPYHWEVEIDFDSDVEQFPEDPLSRPTVVSYSFAQFQQPVWKDVNGQSIVNSAGFYFDPPVEVDQSRLIVTMTRNEPVFDPAVAVNYQDGVNSDPWYGFSAGTVKVQSITGTLEQENGEWFWRVVYEFHVRWDGWTLSVLDQGLYQKGGSGQNPKPCTDNSGNQLVEPALLDGAGNQLANPSPATAVYRNFTVYRSVAFASLALP